MESESTGTLISARLRSISLNGRPQSRSGTSILQNKNLAIEGTDAAKDAAHFRRLSMTTSSPFGSGNSLSSSGVVGLGSGEEVSPRRARKRTTVNFRERGESIEKNRSQQPKTQSVSLRLSSASPTRSRFKPYSATSFSQNILDYELTSHIGD
jgi:hypothetical protein